MQNKIVAMLLIYSNLLIPMSHRRVSFFLPAANPNQPPIFYIPAMQIPIVYRPISAPKRTLHPGSKPKEIKPQLQSVDHTIKILDEVLAMREKIGFEKGKDSVIAAFNAALCEEFPGGIPPHGITLRAIQKIISAMHCTRQEDGAYASSAAEEIFSPRR